MENLDEIIANLASFDSEKRFKTAAELVRILEDKEKNKYSNEELNKIIPFVVKAFIKADKSSDDLHQRYVFSHLLEKIIQLTKTKKNVEKSFNEMSEELIANRSNIYPKYDFFFHKTHEILTSENIKNIVINILDQEKYQFIEKGYVFVLMPFANEFDDIYKYGIKNLLDKFNGLFCQRADEIFHLEDIPIKIFKEIKKAEYIISDLTGKNPNVFYELGYAQGIEKNNIILITRNRDDVPFDLRNIKNIEYQNATNLHEQLKKLFENFGYQIEE